MSTQDTQYDIDTSDDQRQREIDMLCEIYPQSDIEVLDIGDMGNRYLIDSIEVKSNELKERGFGVSFVPMTDDYFVVIRLYELQLL